MAEGGLARNESISGFCKPAGLKRGQSINGYYAEWVQEVSGELPSMQQIRVASQPSSQLLEALQGSEENGGTQGLEEGAPVKSVEPFVFVGKNIKVNKNMNPKDILWAPLEDIEEHSVIAAPSSPKILYEPQVDFLEEDLNRDEEEDEDVPATQELQDTQDKDQRTSSMESAEDEGDVNENSKTIPQGNHVGKKTFPTNYSSTRKQGKTKDENFNYKIEQNKKINGEPAEKKRKAKRVPNKRDLRAPVENIEDFDSEMETNAQDDKYRAAEPSVRKRGRPRKEVDDIVDDGSSPILPFFKDYPIFKKFNDRTPHSYGASRMEEQSGAGPRKRGVRRDLEWVQQFTARFNLCDPDPQIFMFSVRNVNSGPQIKRTVAVLDRDQFANLEFVRAWLVYSNKRQDSELWGTSKFREMEEPKFIELTVNPSTGSIKVTGRPDMVGPKRYRNHLLVIEFDNEVSANHASNSELLKYCKNIENFPRGFPISILGVHLTPNLWLDSQRSCVRSPLLKGLTKLHEQGIFEAMYNRRFDVRLSQEELFLRVSFLESLVSSLPAREEYSKKKKEKKDGGKWLVDAVQESPNRRKQKEKEVTLTAAKKLQFHLNSTDRGSQSQSSNGGTTTVIPPMRTIPSPFSACANQSSTDTDGQPRVFPLSIAKGGGYKNTDRTYVKFRSGASNEQEKPKEEVIEVADFLEQIRATNADDNHKRKRRVQRNASAPDSMPDLLGVLMDTCLEDDKAKNSSPAKKMRRASGRTSQGNSQNSGARSSQNSKRASQNSKLNSQDSQPSTTKRRKLAFQL